MQAYLTHACSPAPRNLVLSIKDLTCSMDVEFREVNPFDLWIWLEFPNVPSAAEQQYLDEVIQSWFVLGQLGGFNAENLQVQETGVDLSYLTYDNEAASQSMMALMHNWSELEYRGTWGRFWIDLGTSDALALDVLINTLRQLSQQYVAIRRLLIGGEQPDWPVPREELDTFFDPDR